MGLPDSEEFDIRYTTLEDLQPLRSWLKSDGILHWYPPSNGEEIEGYVRVWGGFVRYSATITATFQGKPVGLATLYLMPYRKVAHHALFQVIVDPERQRQGVGTALLRNLKHLAKNYFQLELLHAELLDENPPLQSLLTKLGFTEFARQEKYVKKDGVYFPRILMECEL